jgi:Tfp pilus assembly protein PilN
LIKVNLLKDRKLEPTKPVPIRPEVNRMGLLLLLLFIAVAGGLAWKWWQLDQSRTEKLNILESQRTELARLEKVKIAAAQYEKQKQALQNRINVIEQLRRNQTGPVDLLNSILEAVPEQPELWLEVLSQKGNLVHLEGNAMTVETISDFIAALNRTGYFQSVDLEYFTGEQRAVRFSLNCVVAQSKGTPA